MKNLFKTQILALLSAICLVLLFVDGPGHESARSYKYGWNLGHILTFALWTCLLFHVWPGIRRRTFWEQTFVVGILGVLLGGIIELLQGNIGRTANIKDIRTDIAGVLLAMAFLVPSRRAIAVNLRRFIQFFVVILILFETYPFAKAVADEVISARQLPILAGFETPFELGRFTGTAAMRITAGRSKEGRHSLQVGLTTDRYSGISLKYFPHDWRHYKGFGFSALNPAEQPVVITCRIHDGLHKKTRQKYFDRFNRRFALHPGWNDIEISMAEISKAPAGRDMDLADIRGIGIFAASLPSPREIYIDTMRLLL